MTQKASDLYDDEEWFRFCLMNGAGPLPRSHGKSGPPRIIDTPQSLIDEIEENKRFLHCQRTGTAYVPLTDPSTSPFSEEEEWDTEE